MSDRIRDAARKHWKRALGPAADDYPFMHYGRSMYTEGVFAGHRATAHLITPVLSLGAVYGMLAANLAHALPEGYLTTLLISAMAVVPWLGADRWQPALAERIAAKLL